MPVSASAGCMVSVAGEPGMDANAADRGLVAQRGLPAGFHARSERPSDPRCTRSVQPSRTRTSPLFAKNVGGIVSRPSPQPPATSAEIPFVGEHFSASTNHRQLTLSYRLLPPKRRNAARNATLADLCRQRLCAAARSHSGGAERIAQPRRHEMPWKS